jgi:hypothetical protein
VVKQLALEGGGDIGEMLIHVRNEVIAATRGKQIPWEHSALTAKFYFAPPASPDTAKDTASSPAQPAPTYEQQMEIALWNRVKDSKDPAELQAYVDRFPQGAFAPLARILIQRAKREEAQRVAAVREELLQEARDKAQAANASQPTVVATVPSPSPNPTTPPPEPSVGMDREAMVRLLQGELKRLGCYPGSVDGRWGGKTTDALKSFASYAKVRIPSDEPSLAALSAVTARKERVCPLQCVDSEIESKGQCVAKPSKAKVKTRSVEPRREPRRTTETEQSGRVRTENPSPTVKPCLPGLGCGGLRILPF